MRKNHQSRAGRIKNSDLRWNAYTTADTARLSHLEPREIAKVVMVKIDGRMAMAVLPASRRVDITALHTGSEAASLRLASELEFKQQFPDCDAGAMPPFGNLYGMDVFVDEAVVKQARIAFNAGSHDEVMRLTYEDFARLVHPKVLRFATTAERAPRLRLDDRIW